MNEWINSQELVGYKLTKRFGNRYVLNELTIWINKGEIVALLGPNGAGKTTTFSIMAGILPPTNGKVFFVGEDITNLPLWKRTKKGIIYLPQGSSLFLGMNVEENILAIIELRDKSMNKKERRAYAEELLVDFGLIELRNEKVSNLSGGEKKRLELARALATQPKCLLLDEPFSGLDPKGVDKLKELLILLKDRKNLVILLTDHNVYDTLNLVDRAYIIHHGAILCEGDSKELLSSAEVKEAYLGERIIPGYSSFSLN